MRASNSVRSSYHYLYLLLLVCVLPASICRKALGADVSKQKPSQPASAKRTSPNHYCGLYCIYIATRLAGQDVSFRELVKPEYVSSHKGSSLIELKRAAEDRGLYAEQMEKLTSSVLKSSAYPVILHVKSDTNKKEYNHYVLFLGVQNGRAIIFDPPNQVELAPFHELVTRWNGNGLIVSRIQIDLGSIFWPVWKQLIIYTGIIVTIVLMVHWGRQRWRISLYRISLPRFFGLSIVQSIGLLLVALLGGMCYHFINNEGFLAHSNTTTSIELAHLGNFIPKINKTKVGQLLKIDTVFIDARYEHDFEAGHLDGAINIPVNTIDEKRQELMASFARDVHIVVYCQSDNCQFAEKVAIKIMSDGFSNVSLFRGGWRKWETTGND
jgi:rhodanese-related sulfurtransferase